MQIHIISVGKSMPSWVTAGYKEYSQRLPADYSLQLTEITAEKRSKNSDLKRIAAKEEDKILAAIPKGSLCIALDRIGKHIDTNSIAQHLQSWHDINQTICLIIGGPEGLSKEFLDKANTIWSLSKLTLPHPLVRVVLAEQIYRAWSIIVNHPYHR